MQAYTVRNVSAPTITTNFSSQMPFIGHDVFMLSLTYTLKQASSGRRRAVALVGDAGIGKTRIAQQLAKAAVSSKFQVAWATCTSRNRRKTTWATLVAQLLGVAPSQDTAEARQIVHDRLQALDLLDLESALLDLIYDSPFGEAHDEMPAHPREAAADDGRKAGQKVTLVDSLIRFLVAHIGRTPTLLVIDDLQQENAHAIALLKQVLDEIRQARLVVVVTYEPTLTVDLDTQVLVVPDLSEEDTYQVALAILHSSELGPRLKRLVWDRTSGRPLFIEALLRELLQDGYVDQAEGYAELKPDAAVEALPDDVRELVISRLDSFSPENQTVLRAAAALTENFSVALLQSVAELDAAVDLRAVLDDLTRAQMLETASGDEYRFRHGLTQRVIYESLARAQRLKLHRLATRYWREHDDLPYQPIELAYHLVKCGLLPEAIEVVTTVAETAESDGDLDRAVELYTHALGILPDEHSIEARLEQLVRRQDEQELRRS